ncbi:porin family protein [Agrobacterium tumefaciens]|nr:porin family protein [Agrobacterium tumefaciens]NTE17313.1 porin family protein [Agrobacterium tumefaciens]
MKSLKFSLILLLTPFLSIAQNKMINTSKFTYSPAFELLRSTHNNLFYAPSFKANYLFENGLEPGVGLEYCATPIHHDNGYTLHQLRFIPVYANLKYNFRNSKKIKPYAEASVGISFNKYHIADDNSPNNISVTKEQGLYVYTGFGAKYALNSKISTFLGLGFKGYKMSTNDLDINPHGLSFMVGFTFI